jgi:hypothetical protein
MGLQSKLFRGDPKLEAAAVSDPTHIMRGARGEHVRKIQLALIMLDGADIKPDGDYGPATAKAVLAYKQKRGIINRAYQTQADDIVGKMTMASLDAEVVKKESQPRAPIRIVPLSFWRPRPPRHPALHFLLAGTRPLGAQAAGLAPVGAPSIHGGPVLEMPKNGSSNILVLDGFGGQLVVEDPSIAMVQPQGGPDIPSPAKPSDRAPITDDPQSFKVIGGTTVGMTKITATAMIEGGSEASIEATVTGFFSPPDFNKVRVTPHAHVERHRWQDVRANPDNLDDPVFDPSGAAIGQILADLCKDSDTEQVFMDKLTRGRLATAFWSDKPRALKHLKWFLTEGNGNEFPEDENIRDWLKKDEGIKKRLKAEIGAGKMQGVITDFEDYDIPDFKYSFGAIDKVGFEVNWARDAVRVWFKDRYEWHPVYPFYDFRTGDFKRETNCLHAAGVEMKAHGAQDFWMKGQAEVPLTTIITP